MNPVRRVSALLAVMAATLVPVVDPAAADATSRAVRPTTPALFEDGTVLDLAVSWGPATACHVADDGVFCFSSESRLDAYLDAGDVGRVQTMSATCSTTLKLYDGTSWSGALLSLGTRGIWLNLSLYGFNDRTSSYSVGACSSLFAEHASGGGSWYPGSTSAGASAGSMVTGWNNRVSSVYQY
jgi:hypothetical protein